MSSHHTNRLRLIQRCVTAARIAANDPAITPWPQRLTTTSCRLDYLADQLGNDNDILAAAAWRLLSAMHNLAYDKQVKVSPATRPDVIAAIRDAADAARTVAHPDSVFEGLVS